MIHSVFGTKLSRDTNQRQALLKGLVGAMIRSLAIETTEAKAKAVRGLIEDLITKAKRATLTDIRAIEAVVADKELIDKLVHNIAPRIKSKSGGYTKMIKKGYRVGDNAPIVRMELILNDEVVAKPAK
ncbi:MAG: 50S ribosomal protein L17 [Candidatus Amesbacteria bacterium]|nr:50S ribosomal protein L17 [Candidatus Amesbacteria bacterium]